MRIVPCISGIGLCCPSPLHLVRHYLDRFGIEQGQVVLDPFCGTGTTLVECKKLGIRSVGLEPNPIAHFASAIKTSWDVDTDGLLEHALLVADRALPLCVKMGSLRRTRRCVSARINCR